MLTAARDVALYTLSLDVKGEIFDTERLVQYNGTKQAYEGNIRLNKMLWMSQILYLAKYGERMFVDDMEALPNGPTIRAVLEDYRNLLWEKRDPGTLNTRQMNMAFFTYTTMKKAPIKALIDVSHQEESWKEAYNNPALNKIIPIFDYKNTYTVKYNQALTFFDAFNKNEVVMA